MISGIGLPVSSPDESSGSLPGQAAAGGAAPLAVLSGSLQCYNYSDMGQSGGAPGGTVAVWADRLELTVFFRPRVVPTDHVLRVRQLVFRNAFHRLILKLHPLARGLQTIDLVIAHQPGEAYSGDIHYVLGIRARSAAEVLEVFRDAGYPVDWEPRIVRGFFVGAELSLDRL
jgi:hypothetical protein